MRMRNGLWALAIAALFAAGAAQAATVSLSQGSWTDLGAGPATVQNQFPGGEAQFAVSDPSTPTAPPSGDPTTYLNVGASNDFTGAQHIWARARTSTPTNVLVTADPALFSVGHAIPGSMPGYMAGWDTSGKLANVAPDAVAATSICGPVAGVQTCVTAGGGFDNAPLLPYINAVRATGKRVYFPVIPGSSSQASCTASFTAQSNIMTVSGCSSGTLAANEVILTTQTSPTPILPIFTSIISAPTAGGAGTYVLSQAASRTDTSQTIVAGATPSVYYFSKTLDESHAGEIYCEGVNTYRTPSVYLAFAAGVTGVRIDTGGFSPWDNGVAGAHFRNCGVFSVGSFTNNLSTISTAYTGSQVITNTRAPNTIGDIPVQNWAAGDGIIATTGWKYNLNTTITDDWGVVTQGGATVTGPMTSNTLTVDSAHPLTVPSTAAFLGSISGGNFVVSTDISQATKIPVGASIYYGRSDFGGTLVGTVSGGTYPNYTCSGTCSYTPRTWSGIAFVYGSVMHVTTQTGSLQVGDVVRIGTVNETIAHTGAATLPGDVAAYYLRTPDKLHTLPQAVTGGPPFVVYGPHNLAVWRLPAALAHQFVTTAGVSAATEKLPNLCTASFTSGSPTMTVSSCSQGSLPAVGDTITAGTTSTPIVPIVPIFSTVLSIDASGNYTLSQKATTTASNVSIGSSPLSALRPGDMVWGPYPFGTLVKGVTVSGATRTFTFYDPRELPTVDPSKVNIYSPVALSGDGSTPQNLWLIPQGIDILQNAAVSDNFVVGFPTGINFPCDSAMAPALNCVFSDISHNGTENTIIGLFDSGDNTGGGVVKDNFFAYSYFVDQVLFGGVGSLHSGSLSECWESGVCTYPRIFNCGLQNYEWSVGEYVAGNDWECMDQNAPFSTPPNAVTGSLGMGHLGSAIAPDPGDGPGIGRGLFEGTWKFCGQGTEPGVLISNESQSYFLLAFASSCASSLNQLLFLYDPSRGAITQSNSSNYTLPWISSPALGWVGRSDAGFGVANTAIPSFNFGFSIGEPKGGHEIHINKSTGAPTSTTPTSVAAVAAWASATTQISVASCTGVAAGNNAYDSKNSKWLGAVKSCTTPASVAATASWASGASTIAVASCTGVTAGSNIYDYTSSTFIAGVTSCDTGTLVVTLAAPAAAASSGTYPGSPDALLVGLDTAGNPVVTLNAGAANASFDSTDALLFGNGMPGDEWAEVAPVAGGNESWVNLFNAQTLPYAASPIALDPAGILWGLHGFIGNGVHAWRGATLSGQPADGDTITLDGDVWTFKSTVTTTFQVQIGATLAATLQNAVNAWNISTSTLTAKMSYAVDGSTLLFTSQLSGTTGNGYTLAANFATPANITLTSTPINLIGGSTSNAIAFPGGAVGANGQFMPPLCGSITNGDALGYDATHNCMSDGGAPSAPTATNIISYSYTGSPVTYTASVGAKWIEVFLLGGGGGGGGGAEQATSNACSGGSGGGASFVKAAEMQVSALTGTLSVYIGAGGAAGAAATGSSSAGGNGGGGQASYLWNGTTYYLWAGPGGGGAGGQLAGNSGGGGSAGTQGAGGNATSATGGIAGGIFGIAGGSGTFGAAATMPNQPTSGAGGANGAVGPNGAVVGGALAASGGGAGGGISAGNGMFSGGAGGSIYPPTLAAVAGGLAGATGVNGSNGNLPTNASAIPLAPGSGGGGGGSHATSAGAGGAGALGAAGGGAGCVQNGGTPALGGAGGNGAGKIVEHFS